MLAQSLKMSIVVALLLMSGCATQYANVFIQVQDIDSKGEVSSRIYSGSSGAFLLQSPNTLYLTRKRGAADVFLPMIVESDCYQTRWQSMLVSQWADDAVQAALPENKNDVLVLIKKVPGCVAK